MEPALCEHVGNTAHTDGAIKKMMSGKSRNYTRLTRGRLGSVTFNFNYKNINSRCIGGLVIRYLFCRLVY